MDSIDNVRERFEALEQRTAQLHQHTRMVARRLRWWRGIACGVGLLALVSLPLQSGIAQDDPTTTHAVSYTFTTIDVPFPGVTETQSSGINDRRQIVGFYNDSSGSHGFLDDRGTFTTIEVHFPGASPSEINNQGQIVGLFFDSGFLDDHGVFSRIDVPFPGVDQTQAFGINDQGQIVGDYHDSSGAHGFVFEQGVFSSFDVPFPGAADTIAFGINDQGQIVGQYEVRGEGDHGFVDDHGSFTPIDVPGVPDTRARGINNPGQIVGFYFDSSGGTHGFVDTHGSFTPIDVPFPGAHDTVALGINDQGQIVGFYFDSSGGHGFLATPKATFAGTPGTANCHGKSVSALARKFGGLDAAALAPGFPSVQALQDAIREFCEE